MNPKIKHRDRNDRGIFYMNDDRDRKIAELTYARKGSIMTIDHTGVNPEHEGQGLGTELMREAVGYARQHGMRISPLCPFAEVYFDRNEDERDVLA